MWVKDEEGGMVNFTTLRHLFGFKYFGYVIAGMMAFGGVLLYGVFYTWFVEDNMNGALFMLGITAFHYFVWIRSLFEFIQIRTKQSEQMEKLR